VQPAVSPEAFQTVPLCNEDAAAIYDLRLAYRNSLEVNGDSDVSRHHANLSDLVNIAELSVRRVIAMAKQVPAFRALPQVCNVNTTFVWCFTVRAISTALRLARVSKGSHSFYLPPTFIYKWNERSCLYSPAAEHQRSLAGTHFLSC